MMPDITGLCSIIEKLEQRVADLEQMRLGGPGPNDQIVRSILEVIGGSQPALLDQIDKALAAGDPLTDRHIDVYPREANTTKGGKNDDSR